MAGLATGATHSQTLEAWFMHIPGMKVIVPSTPRDGKGLLTSAIFDEDPCLFVETIRLQGQKGLVPVDPGFSIPLGQADIKRPGTDVTLDQLRPQRARCAGGGGRRWQEQGVSAEVVDLRTLVPLDVETHRRIGAPHPAGRGRARRGPVRRAGSRDRRDPAVRAVRRARGTRSSGSARGSSRTRRARRWRRRSTRRRRASSRPPSARSPDRRVPHG